MRNYYNSCCDGEAVIGRIVYGNKYPYGTVSEETYTTDMEQLNGTITDIRDNLYDVNHRTTGLEQIVKNKAERSEVPLIQVLDAEPEDRNCIWFKPVTPDELNSEPTILVQEHEPDINNCIWFKPYSIDPSVLEALLNTNNDPSGSEIPSGIDSSGT